MKRISQIIALLLTICAVSCQKQDIAQDSGIVNLTFSVALQQAPSSKSVAQAEHVDMLFYMPFIITIDEDKEEVATPMYENVRAACIDVTTRQTDVIIPLEKGTSYKVVFWAQDDNCDAYDLGKDLSEVKISYDSASNDDSRDAFYHCEVVVADREMIKPVVLTRPFAQINFASHAEDWAAVQHFLTGGLSSSVEFSANVPDVLNTLTGVASGSAKVVFSEGVSPALTPANQSGETLREVEGENYKGWLSMNYILANPVNQPNIQSIKASFFYDGASCDYLVYDVPFLRNRRTNIIGYFLSESYDVDVKIVKDFYDDIIF